MFVPESEHCLRPNPARCFWATTSVGLVIMWILHGAGRTRCQGELPRLHDPPPLAVGGFAVSERVHMMPEALAFEALVPSGPPMTRVGSARSTRSRRISEPGEMQRSMSELPLSDPSQGVVSDVGTFCISESSGCAQGVQLLGVFHRRSNMGVWTITPEVWSLAGFAELGSRRE